MSHQRYLVDAICPALWAELCERAPGRAELCPWETMKRFMQSSAPVSERLADIPGEILGPALGNRVLPKLREGRFDHFPEEALAELREMAEASVRRPTGEEYSA